MTYEAIAALASAASVVVLAAAAIAGVYQLRTAARQIEESRKSTQLDGMMRIMAQFDEPEFLASQKFIVNELDECLKDPSYLNQHMNPADQPWRPALVRLERLGVYIRLGYLDGEPFHYNLVRPILNMWAHLYPLVEQTRKMVDNPYVWKDTEWLAQDAFRFAKHWMAEHPLPRPSTGEIMRPEDIIPQPKSS